MKNKLFPRILIIAALVAFSFATSAGKAVALTNGTSVTSPYWQSDSSVYTFMAVTHSSLQGMASQIGVTVTALDENRTTTAGTTTFTVAENETHRVFIVATNHSSINSSAQTEANTHFITGTTNFQGGSLHMTANATTPQGTITGTSGGVGVGFPDVTTLSYWSAIVVPSSATGFAGEFIGDLHDSVTTSGSSVTSGQGVH